MTIGRNRRRQRTERLILFFDRGVMSIQDNIAAREAAEVCFALLSEYLQEFELTPDSLAIAWRKLGSMIRCTITQQAAAQEPQHAMSDEEARRFERRTMEFGKYAGQPIGSEVPLSYLVWLDEQPDFRRELNRYLRRREVWAEQETERFDA